MKPTEVRLQFCPQAIDVAKRHVAASLILQFNLSQDMKELLLGSGVISRSGRGASDTVPVNIASPKPGRPDPRFGRDTAR